MNSCEQRRTHSFERLLAVLGILYATLFPVRGETEFKSVKDLKDRYEAAYDSVIQPVHDLNQKYEEALERLLKKNSDAGRLEVALEIKNEIEGFGDGRAFSDTNFQSRETTLPELQRLRETYLRQRNTTFRLLQDPIADLNRKYVETLETFAKEQTRLQNFDSALAATEEIQKVKNLSSPAVPAQLFEGRIRFIVKGEIEIWINGERATFRNRSKDDKFVIGETRPNSFKNGDLLQIKASGSAVFRSLIAFLESDDRMRFIALTADDFRIGGPEHMKEDVRREMIESLPNGPGEGPFDPDMANFWSAMEIPEIVRTECQWVKIESSTDPNYYISILDGSMLIETQ